MFVWSEVGQKLLSGFVYMFWASNIKKPPWCLKLDYNVESNKEENLQKTKWKKTT